MLSDPVLIKRLEPIFKEFGLSQRAGLQYIKSLFDSMGREVITFIPEDYEIIPKIRVTGIGYFKPLPEKAYWRAREKFAKQQEKKRTKLLIEYNKEKQEKKWKSFLQELERMGL